LENKEFEVYYQPKVNLDTNELCGSEALVRWRRAERLLQPEEFIPILEREGSVCALDFYVLERVCENIRVWLDKGLTPVRVSTNFSKLHMHNPKLADDIIKVLQRHDVNPSYIEIELTETIGYEDFEALAAFVCKLHDYGLHTSIDDFGTGYSSLNLVSELDIDVIKLDKSFLTPEDKSGSDAESERIQHKAKSNIIVIKTLIAMARELGISVICEGVETKEQAQLLIDLGCHMAQGYLYDRPMPCEEFENRLINVKYDV
jgi:EAL domain-containing protein (putative c-di-GMP-specific phosphodiesterase class I)